MKTLRLLICLGLAASGYAQNKDVFHGKAGATNILWMANGKEALLRVPSVIIAEEDNVLINPAHPDTERLLAAKIRKFVYDPRV